MPPQTNQSLTERETHPGIFAENGDAQRKGNQRVPMQVLALGASRTGTMSVQRALQILGYQNVWHGWNVLANPSMLDTFAEYLKAKYLPPAEASKYKLPGRSEFEEFFGDCEALTDVPGNLFAEELVRAYQEAKVVLVERNIDSWYESFCSHVIPPMYNPFWQWLGYLEPNHFGYVARFLRTWGEVVLRGKTREEAIANAKEVYREHYNTVREITPPERLLNWDLNDGWGPLCEFLGKPVPDVPLPHENESKAMKARLARLVKKAIIESLKKAAWAAGPLIVTFLAMHYYKSLNISPNEILVSINSS